MFVRRLCAAFPLAAPAKPVTHGRNKGRVGIEERRGGKRERPDPGKPVKFQRPHKRSRHESDGCVYQQPRFPGEAWLLVDTTVAFMAASFVGTLKFYGLSWVWALTLPAAALFYAYATLVSAVRYWLGRGGQWKGRAQAPHKH